MPRFYCVSLISDQRFLYKTLWSSEYSGGKKKILKHFKAVRLFRKGDFI